MSTCTPSPWGRKANQGVAGRSLNPGISTARRKVGSGGGWWGTSDDFLTWAKDSFDVLYAEGATQPKLMSVSLHLRVSGHPGRSAGVARFLDYVLQRPDVWVCRREDVARHWARVHPAGPS